MRILVTGAAGMIGSHAAEQFAQKGWEVVALDNLMRSRLFGSKHRSVEYNWDYLSRYPQIRRIVGDVRVESDVAQALTGGVDAVLHAAGQPGVGYSIDHPGEDFSINAQGTLVVLESVRKICPQARVAFCSTNKVYGDGVDRIPLREQARRYEFDGPLTAVPETLAVDQVGHTPYGASKYTADLYTQEYAHAYGLRTAVFRMSCIYGTRQFGFEDQGWLAWFIICAAKGKPITIYGNGKQVRDALFVTDLIEAYERFFTGSIDHAVWNMGGGRAHTLSLLELLDLIQAEGFPLPPVRYADWRMFDQKVYVSDTAKAQQELQWAPRVGVREGVRRLAAWVRENQPLFQ